MWEFWRSAHKEDNVQPPHGSPFAHPGPHAAVVEARSAGQSNSSTPMHRPATPSVQSDPGSPGFSHGAIPQFNSVGLPAVPERAPSVLTTPTGGSHVSKALSRLLTTSVNFRDVHFVTEASDAKQEDLHPTLNSHDYAKLCTGVQKNKLIIIMVGLPGRGKTFLCNKLMRYLNWLGHATRHFNVGQYRRKQKGQEEVQDARFFDHNNEAGLEARNRALYAALEDMMTWLDSDKGQVAIFDATNSTEQRRQLLRSTFHGRWQYMCIETICNDEEVLQQNYLNKMKYSPDYTGVCMDQALQDFKERIRKYEEVYETLTDRTFHYIKLIDMVTGRGYMDINRISGYIPGKIVFFLMQVCKAGLSTVRKLWLTRHGQSMYNREEKLGGDSGISEDGEAYAELLPAALLSRVPPNEAVSLSVWTSTLRRTIQTARHLPFPKLQWKALDEIDAGVCDGMTYEQIAREMPDEFAARKRDKLRYRYPAGESYLDVTQRLEPVIIEMERERECVLIVSHQAVLRVIYGYFMGVPPEKIPSLEIPLHTLIELTPMPDGTMHEARIPVDISQGEDQFVPVTNSSTTYPIHKRNSLPSGGPPDAHHRTPSQAALAALSQLAQPVGQAAVTAAATAATCCKGTTKVADAAAAVLEAAVEQSVTGVTGLSVAAAPGMMRGRAIEVEQGVA